MATNTSDKVTIEQYPEVRNYRNGHYIHEIILQLHIIKERIEGEGTLASTHQYLTLNSSL